MSPYGKGSPCRLPSRFTFSKSGGGKALRYKAGPRSRSCRLAKPAQAPSSSPSPALQRGQPSIIKTRPGAQPASPSPAPQPPRPSPSSAGAPIAPDPETPRLRPGGAIKSPSENAPVISVRPAWEGVTSNRPPSETTARKKEAGRLHPGRPAKPPSSAGRKNDERNFLPLSRGDTSYT